MRYITFGGISPKIALQNSEFLVAEIAENVRLYGKQLQPLEAPLPTNDYVVDPLGNKILPPTKIKKLHRAGSVWVGFTRDTTVIPDIQCRYGETTFIFADQNALWVTSGERILCGQPPTKLGICQPVGAPTAIVVEGGGCVETMPATPCITSTPEASCSPMAPYYDMPEIYTYVTTYVTADGQESAPSVHSEPVDVLNGDTVMVTLIDTPPSSAVARRWYRALAGTAGAAQFFFAGETPVAQNSFVDMNCALAMGTPLETENDYPPPCVEGVAVLGNTLTVVWAGKNFYVSEPKKPHAYNKHNTQTLLYDIITMQGYTSYVEGAAHYELLALTEGLNYAIAAVLPEDIAIRELQAQYPLANKNAVAVSEGAIAYASEHGLVLIAGGDTKLYTDEFVTRREWAAFTPYDLRLAFDAHELVSATDKGLQLLMPLERAGKQQPPWLSTHTVDIEAFYSDADVGLHFVHRGGIYRWARGEYMLARWKSVPVVQTGWWHPTAFKIVAELPETAKGFLAAKDALSAWRAVNCTLSEEVFFETHPEHRANMGVLLRPDTVSVSFFKHDRPTAWYKRRVNDRSVHRLPRQSKSINWAVQIETKIPVVEVHWNTASTDLTQEGGHG